jgi:hypothetical protein
MKKLKDLCEDSHELMLTDIAELGLEGVQSVGMEFSL